MLAITGLGGLFIGDESGDEELYNWWRIGDELIIR